MSDMQGSIWWLTFAAVDGYSGLVDTAHTHPGRRRKETRLLCAQDDGSHIFLLSCQQQRCTYHLTNDKDAAAHRSQMASLIIPRFDLHLNQTLIASDGVFPPHFFLGIKSTKEKTRSEHVLTELESSDSFSRSCPSIYHLIIQRENENWCPKHLCLNKERSRLWMFKK